MCPSQLCHQHQCTVLINLVVLCGSPQTLDLFRFVEAMHGSSLSHLASVITPGPSPKVVLPRNIHGKKGNLKVSSTDNRGISLIAATHASAALHDTSARHMLAHQARCHQPAYSCTLCELLVYSSLKSVLVCHKLPLHHHRSPCISHAYLIHITCGNPIHPRPP